MAAELVPRIVMISMLALIGCDILPINQTYVAPELYYGTVPAYVEEFYQVCPNAPRVPLVVLVPRLPTSASPTAIATCTLTSNTGEGSVFIETDKFLSRSDVERRWVVWHELTHCSLGIKHQASGYMFHAEQDLSVVSAFTNDDLKQFCP